MISVIIPTYGEPSFLKDTIKSVLAQTIKSWELIIVDDNNPGTEARRKTEQLVNEFISLDRRIKYIKHEYNKNGAVARNTGFAVAKGEYIALLDSDDLYLPNRLQKCYELMHNASGDIAGVYTGCEFRRGGKVYSTYSGVRSGRFLKETLACKFMFCTGSNIFVRKSVIDELNGFDPAFLRQQDYEFLVRLFEKYSLIGLNEVLVIKNNENINVPNLEKLIVIRRQYLDKYKYIIDSMSDEDRNYVFFWNCISIAEAAMAQKKYNKAHEYYKKAKSYGHLPIKTQLRRIVFPIYNLVK